MTLREPPAEWPRLHGYRPLLAEIAHDIARHQGCYCKVTTLCGFRDLCRLVDHPLHLKSRRHPISAMLALFCYGLLCETAAVNAIWRLRGPLANGIAPISVSPGAAR